MWDSRWDSSPIAKYGPYGSHIDRQEYDSWPGTHSQNGILDSYLITSSMTADLPNLGPTCRSCGDTYTCDVKYWIYNEQVSECGDGHYEWVSKGTYSWKKRTRY